MIDSGFSKPIRDIIKSRTSIRTFSKAPLPKSLDEKLTELLNEPQQSPFNGKCGFHTIDIPKLERDEQKKLGTYGFISGAPKFIAVTSENDSNYFREHIGYVLEKIILHLTDLGIGTCWIAGSFNKENFRAQLGLKDDVLLPIITPVGIPAKRRRIKEMGIRAMFKADKAQRQPWSKMFFRGDFSTPLDEKNAGDLKSAFEMIRLGPSAANRQPWRILVNSDGTICHFFIEPSNAHFSNFARFDIGIATCHFNLSLMEAGIQGAWKIMDQPQERPENYTYIISWQKT
nr:nitroreductase family protein [Candidatus Sigynarchaeota archaeon]